MRIKCRHCQRIMYLSEYLAYVGMYVLEGVAELAKVVILKALRQSAGSRIQKS